MDYLTGCVIDYYGSSGLWMDVSRRGISRVDMVCRWKPLPAGNRLVDLLRRPAACLHLVLPCLGGLTAAECPVRTTCSTILSRDRRLESLRCRGIRPEAQQAAGDLRSVADANAVSSGVLGPLDHADRVARCVKDDQCAAGCPDVLIFSACGWRLIHSLSFKPFQQDRLHLFPDRFVIDFHPPLLLITPQCTCPFNVAIAFGEPKISMALHV